jgi:methionyl-tRNA synthetase
MTSPNASKRFYITTTLPYVNAEPHVGFAMEIIRADVLAHYHRSIGDQVFFNTGTDEHGAKIHDAASKEEIDTQAYTDRYAKRFRELKDLLNLSVDNFIRTTDPHHVIAAQEFWKRCDANGDIYKKLYRVKYCIGCELEKTDSELDENGRCPLHPNRELEIREEENYFFRFSNYTEKLKQFYENNPTFVIPDFRYNEIKAFADRGFEDFSISRLASKMPWGVPVPGDDAHVMYVWFDALVNYVSAIGWPDRMNEFETWWPVIQYCGKDNNRQQSAMWQAMLMSAKLANSKHIIINGFITSQGQKMSKSLGNVINPFDLIEFFKPYTDFPEDVLRFVLLHDIPSFEDGDLTMESIKTSYAAHLQNGIGNLTSRIMKMATSYEVTKPIHEEWEHAAVNNDLHNDVSIYMERYELMHAIECIWREVGALDLSIQNQKPFQVWKVDEKAARNLVQVLVHKLAGLAIELKIFLPRTSLEILRLIRENKMPETPLFNRLP